MSFKFGQIEIATKDFYKTKKAIDIIDMDINSIVVSDPIPCNDAKDHRYTIGYQTDDSITPLFIKTPKNIYSNGVSQYNKTSSWTMGFGLEYHEEWLTRYKKIWSLIEKQIFTSLTKSCVNKDVYINPKIKQWNNEITTNFYNKGIPYNQHCEASAVLKIASVYRQGSDYYPQVYVEECKYRNFTVNTPCMLSDSEGDEGIDESWV